MKKHLAIYFVLLSSLPCFSQYFQTGDVQLGFAIARQRQLQIFGNQFGFFDAQKRYILAAEYHIVENASLYASYDIAPKSSFFNENEKTNTNSKLNAWNIGGRWFSTGLFHGHLYFYGDLGYGQFNVLKTKIDATDKIELQKMSEKIRFSGFAGGICIKPSKYFSIDINLLRIGAIEKIFTLSDPFEESIKIQSNHFLFGLPFFPSDYDATGIRLNFIFSTQKNKTDE